MANPTEMSTAGKHRKRPVRRNAVLDNFDLCVLRNIVNDFYAAKRKSSLKTLLPVVKEKINFPWKEETLRKFFHQIGFRWKLCRDKRQTMIECANIVAWRSRFLRQMNKFREILRVFKAGSATGDYHGQMNNDQFEKWLRMKLIPNVPPKSVICTDDVTCCRQQNYSSTWEKSREKTHT